MAKWTVSVVAALAGLAQAAAGAAKPVVLDKAQEYPHVGLGLAVPVGYVAQPLVSPYDVMKAVVAENYRPVEGVTLSAFPAMAKVTADEFAEAKMNELKKNLAIQQLKLLKKTAMPVAGVNGSARLMSYTFRGLKTLAAQVYFLRDVKDADVRICYLLTVVCSVERQPRLLPTLGAVVRSVRTTSVRHPELRPELKLGEPIEDYDLGYFLRRPAGWYAAKIAAGAELGQVDYLLGGVSMPSAQLLVTRVSGEAATSEGCGKMYLGMAKAAALQRKQACQVVSEGPAKLGMLPAYQFVLVQSAQVGATAPRTGIHAEPVVIVQRTACLTDTRDGKPMVYALVLTARGNNAKPAEGLISAMAASFRHLESTTQPATQPATRPATRPTTPPAPATGG